MKLELLPKEFRQGIPVINALENAGYEAYFVGGSVRDVLLGKAIHDVDIATSAYPQEVKKIFKRTVDVGIEHGTVLVLFEEEQYEITTFRTESTYQDYRRPDQVTFVRSLTEDLKRRDFTINALAMDQSGEIIDLFAGIKDLELKTIKAVGNASERFNEDALRMLRALRFASQLDFTIAEATLEAVREHHQLLAKISVERIQVEWLKLMLGQKRNRGLELLIETDCYKYCPGLKNQRENLVELTKLPDTILINDGMVWLILAEGLKLKSEEIQSFLQGWKCSNQMIKQVANALTALRHRLVGSWTAMLLYQTGEDNIRLVEETLPYFGGHSEKEEALKDYQQLAIHQLKEMKITGKEILALTTKQAGPWLGKLLQELEHQVINGILPNQKEQLLAEVKGNLKASEIND